MQYRKRLGTFSVGSAAFVAVVITALSAAICSANVNLHVESTGATSVPITGTKSGTTPYNASTLEGTVVTLAAPAVRGGGWVVDHWEDGTGKVLSTNASVTATVNAAMTLRVVYTYVATIYYVNDSSFAEVNSICSAAGNDTNDGLMPSRPKATVQSVIDTYDLSGGAAVVYIDPGTYVQRFSIGSADAGARFIGASMARTFFNVPSGQTGFNANGCAARVEEMTFNGTHVAAQGIANLNGGGVIRCKIYNMTGDGLTFSGPTTVTGCTFDANGGHGVSSDSDSGALINNVSTNNTDAAYFCSGNLAMRSSGNTATGNGANAIVIGTGWMVNTSGTFTPQPLPYRVRNNGGPWYSNPAVTITGGAVVNVDPGVRFEFESGTGLWVFGAWGTGTFNVNGTAANPVLFTSAQATPAAGDWLGVNVQTYNFECSMTMAYATVEYAGAWNAAIPNNGATVTISNSVIRHSNNHGIYNTGTLTLTGSTIQNCGAYGLEYGGGAGSTVTNCTFTANTSGVNITGTGVSLANCTASSNVLQGLFLSGGTGSATGCTFTANGDNGVYGDSPSFTLTNNTATNNANAAYYVGGNVAMLASGNAATGNGTNAIVIGTGWMLNTSGTFTPQVLPFRVRNNGGPWYGTPAVTISGGAVVNVDPGVRFEFESGTGLWCFGNWGTGTLNVNGTAANPVLFTSAQATPAAGDWLGINVQTYYSECSMTMAYATVEYAGAWNAAIPNNGASVTITDSVIRHSSNHGIYNNGTLTLTGSTVQNCASYGLEYAGGAASTVTGCTFTANASGVNITGSGVSLANCTASANTAHGVLISGGTGSATGCTFTGNGENGVYGDSPSFTLTNNTSTNNTAAAYFVGGNVAMLASGNTATGNATNAMVIGTGWLHNTSGTFTHQTLPFRVRNNGGPWYSDPYLTISGNVVVNVNPGVRFEFEPSTGIWVFGAWGTGTLNVNGTAAAPVVFTSDAGTTPGHWRGLYAQNYYNNTQINLRYAQVLYGTWGYENGGLDATVDGCLFFHNGANGFRNNTGYSTTITNTIFDTNYAPGGGAGIDVSGGNVQVINSVFYNEYFAIYRQGGYNVSVANSIFLGNYINFGNAFPDSVSYSCLPGDTTYPGTNGNISADPSFVDAGAGNYRLWDHSPCIDTADTALAPATDMAGNSRRDDAGMLPNGSAYADMGVHEFQGTSQQDIVYVNDGSYSEAGSACTAIGNDANDGFNPQRPMRTIQGALNKYAAFGTGKTIQVDPGTYVENVSIAATHAGLKIKGAGAGKSIVDGNAAGPVFVATGFGAGEISGLTIQNGSASGSFPNQNGGGVRLVSGSSPLIANNIIKGNVAASGGTGGGLYAYNNSTPVVRNCLIYGNTRGGLGFYNAGGTVVNCTIASNTVTGIYKGGTGTLTVTNDIVWANGDDLSGCTATYSCIEDGDAGTGNMAFDPLFANAAAGNYHLLDGSPCIDTADTSAAPGTDLEGVSRRDDSFMLPNGSAYADMGAYEFPGSSVVNTLYVNDGSYSEAGSACTAVGNDANSGTTPKTPMRTIQGALNKYPSYGGGKVLWVDPGTYAENVNIVATHAGLKIKGAGAGKSIVDGNAAGPVFVATGFGAGEISGLTIRNGLASGTFPAQNGGGIRLVNGSSPLIANNVLQGNVASSGGTGGGLYAYNNSTPVVRNCLIYGNTRGGLGFYNAGGTVVNCTIANNTVTGIYKGGTGTLTVTNDIVWANGDDLSGCTATYSCIEDGDAGTGNTALNPLFANTSAGNYALSAGSPCIDTADTSAAPGTDILGNARRDDAGTLPNGSAYADMGAYEFQGVSAPLILYVNDDSTEGDVFCTAAGDDANDGFTPATPMRHIQALLNKYPNVGARTAKIDTGMYLENVSITTASAGWKLQGAGAMLTVVDGDAMGPVFVATGFGAGEISGLTVQNGLASGSFPAQNGGGIRLLNGSSPLIANCIIKTNSAGSGGTGGGLYAYNNSTPVVRNCLIYGNTRGGLGFYNAGGTVINCTVADNAGNGIYKGGTGTLAVTNCIAWANVDDLNGCTATYSCIEDGDAGTGNIATNPSFANEAAGDYHLNSGSPCIDTGTATGAPTDDLEGNARDATPDRGAYEHMELT